MIRLSSLGDVVLATAAVEALAQNGFETVFVTKSEYAPLFSEDPRISEVVVFDGVLSTARRVRRLKPDYVIDLHGTARTFVISALVGRRVLRVRKRSIRRRALVHLGIGDRTPRSVVDDIIAVLKRLPAAFSGNLVPKLFPTKAGVSKAKKLLGDLPRPIALLHPGAKHPLKNWGRERFVALASLLRERGISVAMISDGKAADESFRCTGELTLEELVGVISFVDVFVGNDSGPSHIAAALDVPSVTIFGPTHPALGFVPRGRFAEYIFADAPCSPCTLHGEGKCRTGDMRCFEAITPKIVCERVLGIIERTLQRVSA